MIIEMIFENAHHCAQHTLRCRGFQWWEEQSVGLYGSHKKKLEPKVPIFFCEKRRYLVLFPHIKNSLIGIRIRDQWIQNPFVLGHGDIIIGKEIFS